MRQVYKLQILLSGNETLGTEDTFRDFYFDVSKITGFYIPDIDSLCNEPCINIFFEGDYITIKQEPHIIQYLTEEFATQSIKA